MVYKNILKGLICKNNVNSVKYPLGYIKYKLKGIIYMDTLPSYLEKLKT